MENIKLTQQELTDIRNHIYRYGLGLGDRYISLEETVDNVLQVIEKSCDTKIEYSHPIYP